MADVLFRADRVLQFDRAARPLSLFDRCARRIVHHLHSVYQMSYWLFGRDYTLFRSSGSRRATAKRAIRKRVEKWSSPHLGVHQNHCHAVGELGAGRSIEDRGRELSEV